VNQDNGSNRHVDGPLDIDPESLSHQQLIDLVHDLQGALAGRGRQTPASSPAAGNVRLHPVRAVPGADYTVFHALIAALEDLLERVGSRADALSIAVRGDSQLVIRGLTGEWRVKHPGLQPLHQRAADLLRRFRNLDLAWHPRQESVRTFGH
jgi:hypothetical protein